MSPSQAFKQKLHDIIQEVMEEADIWKTCINCKSFNEDQELCKLCVPASRPPARVIAFGCPAFAESDSVQVKPEQPAPIMPISKPKVKDFSDMDDDIPF